jgi:hypothetical protein
MPRFLEAEQGTAEWHAQRAGHATASRFKDILAGKGAREAYLYQLAGERLSGEGKRSAGSQSLAWGKEAEDLARQEYEDQTGEFVKQVGFAVHSSIKWVGASSDALVGDKGCIEIKSPFDCSVHTRTLDLGMPGEHTAQVQGNLWILERDWIDFCSYDPAFPSPYNLHRQRFWRDESFIKHTEREVKKFLAEVNVVVNRIKQSKRKEAA